ncbi:MFS transporter [Shewanella sp. A32]|uniref:MFS transporter n=1 Tax=Shewanella sp. A32 TaxID=3031327 RepID=UPI0023B9D171|nr:MFS transporter [Shewanella sp. A32]MDF0534973.1 MFS transporter [Shewanella sp. A32]
MLTLIGTIIAQFALGSVYTWSLFNAGLADKLHVPVDNVAFSFGILSLSLALASSISGKMQERFGVTKVTIAAGLMMGAGLLLTAHASSVAMLYLCAGFLLGFADGTGYLLTLSNCVRWFPERKGTISALSIGAYGLGSLGFKYINLSLLQHAGLNNTFLYWGAIATVMVVIGGLLMTDAPKQAVDSQRHANDFTLAEAIVRPQFWMLALIFLTVCMSGLYVIGVAKDIGEQYAGLTFSIAANAVAIIAMANLGGRLVLGVLSDKMPRIRVVSLALLSSLTGMAILLFTPMNMMNFYVALGCIAFSFGGTITVYPSLVSDFFGLNNLTKNYGAIYLGFGIGSLCGSMVAAMFGSFSATFTVIMGLLALSLLLSLLIKTPVREPQLA